MVVLCLCATIHALVLRHRAICRGSHAGIAAPPLFLSCIMKKRRAHAENADALRLSEQRFHAILDAAADAMVLSNADGIVIAANAAYYQLYGYPPEQVLGKSFAIIFPEERRA